MSEVVTRKPGNISNGIIGKSALLIANCIVFQVDIYIACLPGLKTL
jgi:hypothetical protein